MTVECGLVLLARVFNVYPYKWYTCNTIHHKKSLYFLVVEKKLYTKMSSVPALSVLTVKNKVLKRERKGDEGRQIVLIQG